MASIGSANSPAKNPTAPAADTYSLNRRITLYDKGASGPQESDVNQSSIGDCYLAGPAAALAEKAPGYIQNDLITPKGSNVYDIHAFPHGSPTDIYVDGSTLSTRNGDDTGLSGNGGSMWAGQLEKAYALATGTSIDGIGNGGWPADALQFLTGEVPQTWSAGTYPTAGEFASLVGAPGQSGNVVASATTIDSTALAASSNYDASSKSLTVDGYKITNADTSAVDTKFLGKNPGLAITDPNGHNIATLVQDHAYAVDGVTSTDPSQPDPTKVNDPDKLNVQLTNPLGGTVKIPYSVYQAVTTNTAYVPTPGTASAAVSKAAGVDVAGKSYASVAPSLPAQFSQDTTSGQDQSSLADDLVASGKGGASQQFDYDMANDAYGAYTNHGGGLSFNDFVQSAEKLAGTAFSPTLPNGSPAVLTPDTLGTATNDTVGDLTGQTYAQAAPHLLGQFSAAQSSEGVLNDVETDLALEVQGNASSTVMANTVVDGFNKYQQLGGTKSLSDFGNSVNAVGQARGIKVNVAGNEPG